MKRIFSLLIIYIFIVSCSTKNVPSLPKTLLFSVITPEYLHDTASEWRANGFDGFMFANIMSNWSDDIWATDGDPETRQEDDGTYQRVKSCNDACRRQGITENFIKIAFYSHVPLWTDDVAWQKMYQNFEEAARFAKMTGSRGIALDIEYVNEQYHLDWEGYDYHDYTEDDLRKAAVKRGRELVGAMLRAYPDMVFLTLPEGVIAYGPLAGDFFIGMLQGMAQANAPEGLHVLTERSYNISSSLGLIHYVSILDSRILERLDSSVARYWKEKCSIAVGGYPLGYYRKVFDEKGKFLGYGGKAEKFGDKIIGAYGDKSSRFTPDEFRNQYAGMLLGSNRYCWIYGHGAAWWQFSDEDVARYGKVNNSQLPVDEQLEVYKKIVREKWRGSEQLRSLSRMLKQRKKREFMQAMNFVTQWKIIGPFGSRGGDNFNDIFPPEKEINFQATYQGSVGQVTWQTVLVDSITGYLDFVKYFRPKDWVCAYAFCNVVAPENMAAQIRLGTNDMGTLWFNGEKILSKNKERSAAVDDDILSVTLNKGKNMILVKVCNTELNWGLYLRVTDEDGGVIAGLKYLSK